MHISVVLSFRNEEDVLQELINRLESVFNKQQVDYELIFVDDASNDNSYNILLGNNKRNPRVKIITMSRRFGNTPCVLAGFRHATGDAIIYMDCDLQDPPEIIPRLLEKWRDGADIVHTTRTLRHGEHPFKMWLTRLAYGCINRIADIHIPVNSGDFKLISRRAINELLKLDEFDPFMRGLVAWVGFKQVQVFYERSARYAGTTKFSLWRSINPYQEFVRGLTRFSDLPLYFALITGFILSLVSVVYIVLLVIRRFMGVPMDKVDILIFMMLVLGGGMLFTNGVLGIYVGIIHKEVKKRPRYIISSRIGFDV